MTKVLRSALYAPLRLAQLYNLLQRFVGADRDRVAFVRAHVVFRPGDKIVDAGCGTGSALEFLPPVTRNRDMRAEDGSCAETPTVHECAS